MAVKQVKLEIEGTGIRLIQPDSQTIKVIEGGSTARIFGAGVLLGGTLLAWNSFGNIFDLSFFFGLFLMLFGAAVATQRYVMTLDRLHGTWSYGGDIFFIISFKNRGSFSA